MPAAYSNESEVRAALLQGSYRPGMIAPLEDYLAAAVAGAAPYVSDAVRTLVKLYQLFPAAALPTARRNWDRPAVWPFCTAVPTAPISWRCSF